MQEHHGDLWELYDALGADAAVITTNGMVKKNGQCVMGRGCALEAARKWPDLPLMLGRSIDRDGNHVHSYELGGVRLLTMPVKHHWREKADIELVLRSASELVRLADEDWLHVVVMPRPGCGNGQLDWADVGMELEAVLDNRFIVCHK